MGVMIPHLHYASEEPEIVANNSERSIDPFPWLGVLPRVCHPRAGVKGAGQHRNRSARRDAFHQETGSPGATPYWAGE